MGEVVVPFGKGQFWGLLVFFARVHAHTASCASTLLVSAPADTGLDTVSSHAQLQPSLLSAERANTPHRDNAVRCPGPRPGRPRHPPTPLPPPPRPPARTARAQSASAPRGPRTPRTPRADPRAPHVLENLDRVFQVPARGAPVLPGPAGARPAQQLLEYQQQRSRAPARGHAGGGPAWQGRAHARWRWKGSATAARCLRSASESSRLKETPAARARAMSALRGQATRGQARTVLARRARGSFGGWRGGHRARGRRRRPVQARAARRQSRPQRSGSPQRRPVGACLSGAGLAGSGE